MIETVQKLIKFKNYKNKSAEYLVTNHKKYSLFFYGIIKFGQIKIFTEQLSAKIIPKTPVRACSHRKRRNATGGNLLICSLYDFVSFF